MENQQIELRYKSIVSLYEKEDIDLTNRVNCYLCSCGHITKTKDIHKGVTPFMHECEKCKGTARSSFYKDIVPEKKPTQEWFRPSLKEVLKFYKKNPSMLEHILQGGLDVRKI